LLKLVKLMEIPSMEVLYPVYRPRWSGIHDPNENSLGTPLTQSFPKERKGTSTEALLLEAGLVRRHSPANCHYSAVDSLAIGLVGKKAGYLHSRPVVAPSEELISI